MAHEENGGHLNYFAVFIALCVFTGLSVVFDLLKFENRLITIVLVLAQVYYFTLSVRLGLGLLLYNVFMIQLAVLVEQTAAYPLWQIALALFVLAWIGQFIGHMIEGKRPSFFKDLQFLLIGPAWLMSFLYRATGLKF